MNRKELRILQSELDMFGDRVLRWSSNLEVNMGSTYNIEGGTERARMMGEVGTSLRSAAYSFSDAARKIAELLESKD